MKTLISPRWKGSDPKQRPVDSPRAITTPYDRPVGKPDDRDIDDIYRRMVEFLPRLRRFTLSLTGDRAQSDDLVQETCVRALTHLDQWQPDSRLDSWMYRIAQNLWIDHLRAEKVRGEIVDIATVTNISGCDGRQVVENRFSILELKKCIARLPSDQCALLRLICVDGLSYKQAAAYLRRPTGTIMSRLARARHALLDAISGRRSAQ